MWSNQHRFFVAMLVSVLLYFVDFQNITSKWKEPPKRCRELLKLNDLHRRSPNCPIYKFTRKTSISCFKNIAKNTGKQTVILFLGDSRFAQLFSETKYHVTGKFSDRVYQKVGHAEFHIKNEFII